MQKRILVSGLMLMTLKSFAQGLTPDEIETLQYAFMSDTNIYFRLADKCPSSDNIYWELQFGKAVLLYESKQYAQAIDLFLLVKDAAPAFAARSYQCMGMAKAEQGDAAGSKIASQTAETLYDAGTKIMHSQNYTEAIKYYSSLLSANPICTNAIVFASLAYAQERLDLTNDALATCEKWVKAMPECPAAFRQRGGVKWKLGDKAGAQADFDKVKRLGGRVDAKKPADEPPAR